MTRPAGASCPTSSATTFGGPSRNSCSSSPAARIAGVSSLASGTGHVGGWITVRFITQEEEPDISDGACGRARVGHDPGEIWIIRRARGNKYCVDPRYFPELFTHEFGHAMGFRHVEDRTAIMANSVWNGQSTFSPREQYHAQLAFEVGRGHEYCGWPFQRKCATPKRGFRTVAPAHRPPIIVID